MKMLPRTLLTGACAGAAGTLMLNVASYLDMMTQGRQASGMPAQLAGKMARETGVEALSEDNQSQEAEARRSAAGALMGYGVGMGLALVYAFLRAVGLRPPALLAGIGLGVGAMLASDVPLAATGLTDPRQWRARDLASDIVPHLAYGLIAASTVHALEDMARGGRRTGGIH